MRFSWIALLTLAVACSSKTKTAENPAAAAPQFLTGMNQLTIEGKRAGEGYFSKDGNYLVFQSEREPGNPFYQIYVMNMSSGAINRVSPGQGKTTCAWIHPSNKKIMFASTHADPDLKRKTAAEWEERKNPKSKYNWSFDDAYEIYETSLDGKNPKNLTRAKGYDAEGSYSPDGKWIAFASNRAAYTEKMTEEQKKAFERDPSYMMDLYIMRADGTQVKRLTTSPGYDGGPFFSPDGKRITFRRFSPDGHSAEVFTMNVDGTDEKQITNLKAMSWAPFYHPSGDYIIFATNINGYANFELYIVDTAGAKTPVRVTNMAGFDGLPVFRPPHGNELVWTHSNERGEAQLYRAIWNDDLARRALGLAAEGHGTGGPDPTPAPPRIRKWVNYLADARFEGRATGSPHETEYTNELANAFRSFGYRAEIETYEFTSGVELEPNANSLTLHLAAFPEKATLGTDWIPLSYSKNGKYRNALAVFAGYGIVAPASGTQPTYDSYDSLDVKGKWAIAFAGLPDEIPPERRFHLHLYSRLQHKAMMARQNGAVGLIIVDDSKTPPAPMSLVFEGRAEDAGIPVIRLSPALADKVFKSSGATRADWTAKLAKGETPKLTLATVSAQADVGLKFKKSTARNVVARLNAGPGHKNWATVIGAHLDHLGRGEHGNSLSKEKNAIHFGADDNASGVAAVMEVAQQLAARVKSGELKLKQSVIFGLWTGEELGLLGSSAFVNRAVMKSSERVSAYLNLDMVGRLRDALSVQGIGSAAEWKSLIERVNYKTPIALKTQEDPYLPTDAMAFYLKQIPAISFFTGSHSEYHTGNDTPDLLNYEGIAQVSSFITEMAATLAASADPLVKYRKVEGTRRESGGGRGFRLYLGTIPDYTAEEKGVKISGTSKDSPAEKAGLKAGDIIVEMGGVKIQSLHDYMYCLQALKANEKTKMRVLRSGREQELEIVPALRTQQ